jgi:TolB protein
MTTPLPPLSGSGGGVIAFQSDRDRQDEIYVMNADGSEQRLLISNRWALDSMPAWSPDGTLIAFRSNRAGYVDVYVISAEGGSLPQQLTHNAESDQDRAPAWRPVGTDTDPAR